VSVEARGGVRGVVELGELARRRLARGAASVASLAAMVAEFCGGLTLDKPPALRLSNWEDPHLSFAQLSYAASDAYAGLRVHEAIVARAPCTPPAPLRDATNTTPAATPGGSPPQCAATGEGEGGAGATPRAPFVVAARAEPAHLAPSKLAVLELFSGAAGSSSVAAIAERRGVKEDTVRGYLADAIEAGHAYDWNRFAVPTGIEAAIADAARSVRAARLAQSDEGPASSSSRAERGGETPAGVVREVRERLAANEVTTEMAAGAGSGSCRHSYALVKLVVAHLARTALEVSSSTDGASDAEDSGAAVQETTIDAV